MPLVELVGDAINIRNGVCVNGMQFFCLPDLALCQEMKSKLLACRQITGKILKLLAIDSTLTVKLLGTVNSPPPVSTLRMKHDELQIYDPDKKRASERASVRFW